MKPIKCLMIIAFSMMSCTAGAVNVKPENSIAYRDTFVWYLADQMATPLLAALFPAEQLSPEDHHQFRYELSLLYHHALIACDGPLDQIAAALHPTVLSDKKRTKTIDIDAMLISLGVSVQYTQPILNKWNDGVLPGIVETFKARKATTLFPKCMNPRYVIPKMAFTSAEPKGSATG